MTYPDFSQDINAAPKIVAASGRANAIDIRKIAHQIKLFGPTACVIVAQGSSMSAGQYLSRLIHHHVHIPALIVDPTDVKQSDLSFKSSKLLVIAISKSGETESVTAACERLRLFGHLTLAITNEEESSLAAVCEYVLPLHGNVERCSAVSITHLASCLNSFLLVSCWSGKDEALTSYCDYLEERLEHDFFRNCGEQLSIFVIDGPIFIVADSFDLSAATEVAIKLRELYGVHAEACVSEEFWHSADSAINAESKLLIIRSHYQVSTSLRQIESSVASASVRHSVASIDNSSLGQGNDLDLNPISLTFQIYKHLPSFNSPPNPSLHRTAYSSR